METNEGDTGAFAQWAAAIFVFVPTTIHSVGKRYWGCLRWRAVRPKRKQANNIIRCVSGWWQMSMEHWNMLWISRIVVEWDCQMEETLAQRGAAVKIATCFFFSLFRLLTFMECVRTCERGRCVHVNIVIVYFFVSVLVAQTKQKTTTITQRANGSDSRSLAIFISFFFFFY